MILFDNSYARLPDVAYAKLRPTPVKAPSLVAYNSTFAKLIGLDLSALNSAEKAQIFAGNQMLEGFDPLAAAYSGHQFGQWNHSLGDGRAILLGEVIGTDGQRRDIQLKGSGRTPYSRNGDGRAWLGPVLREYVLSEAMHALGIPTTRALAAVTTGENIQRETSLPGAIITRVAQSHIRVGSFQYFAARGDMGTLQALYDHVVARHYPTAKDPNDLLRQVIENQAKLIAAWMSVGFIHGVMNTDNFQIAGETIDYGPCAFLDSYHPDTVFSSIDRHGRYRYTNQPDIAVWNMAQFATALVPLMPDQNQAIEQFTETLDHFAHTYKIEHETRFLAKIGLTKKHKSDMELVQSLLDRMSREQADFTNTFRALSGSLAREQFTDPTAFDTWGPLWRDRLEQERDPVAQMKTANPTIIPRNHRVEQMIQSAVDGDYAPFERLTVALSEPFKDHIGDLTHPPQDHERVSATFCGT